MKDLNKTKISLFYLATYLIVIGSGLLFAPRISLSVLQSNADYGDLFPRVAGMLMSGLGFTVVGLIRAKAYELYPATLVIRVYFLLCFIVFYSMNKDPLFMVLLGIVGIGFLLTLSSYILDRREAT
jgi:hypothetical protein